MKYNDECILKYRKFARTCDEIIWNGQREFSVADAVVIALVIHLKMLNQEKYVSEKFR